MLTHTHNHTHRVHRACGRPLISILICLSHCWFLHAFLLVSAAYITWMRRPSTMRAEGGLRRGRHYHTVCLHQCTISIIGPVIETNHCLSVAVAPATHIQISFRLSRKLKRGELTCDPFLIFRQQSGQPWGGYFIFQWGTQTICLRCIILHPKEWQNWPQHRATKNKPNRTLQFHGDTAWCNEVTLWLPSYPHEKSSMPF